MFSRNYVPWPDGPNPGAEQSEILIPALADKKIGLIVNQSSMVGDAHLIDVLQEQHINITSLFAVEHGIRGTADAGAKIENSRDAKSGLAITSLYGKKKAPSKEDVANLDLLVFDLQDVGVRFFTYLSSLHYIMESCAQYNTPLLILDRPNPNISHIDGPILEPEFASFVGIHPIPVLHGMTLGELAQMINGEGWLTDAKQCALTIIPVKDYTRNTEYELPVKPSPNLPNQKAINLYPSLALFEATNISVGRGTDFPFQVLGGEHNALGQFSFTPVSTPGAALNPKLIGKKLFGIDYRQAQISGLQIEIFINWYERTTTLNLPFITRAHWLDKLMGTNKLRKQVQAGVPADEIRDSWVFDLDEFKKRRAPYLIYPDTE